MYHQQKSHSEIGVINASTERLAIERGEHNLSWTFACGGLDSLVRRATSCRRLPEDLRSASTLSLSGAVGAGRGTICRSASGGWHLSWSKPKGWLWDAIELILNQSFYGFLIFHAFGKKCKLNYVWCTQTDCWRAKTYFSSVFLETWLIYICLYNLSELRFMFGKGWRTDSDLAELFF
jgi:hypothetical protein